MKGYPPVLALSLLGTFACFAWVHRQISAFAREVGAA